ncbi:uncharacterized protein LOC130496286 isoform X1 [Raphanus sativus]|uniref:Uncharacterized protein LOC130496286 isoform X1 n=1 Tax=Raphanus sativus TaxID=3726 RepID=A0A9W3BY73_RAPSA|nr:uncharacterized protein LOC130496286 isoform X1 [Raphanus sativus]XP_056844225.1 uncharacterized protein LOC130496286 isoform X1 [Raphanus sativus]XP_056844226.1 uncharacterized protein LOC130496286 isoform X1 [Raphanus sativus]
MSSGGTVRRVSRQDIQLVQNLIERCLQLYMNQKEVVETLLEQAKIEPGFTELVWQKLEEENREFFKAYYLRLMVKHQIMEFNKLLEQQVQHMRQMHPSGVTSVQNTNGGSHIQSSINQKHLGYASEHTDQSLKSISSSLSNAYLNGSSTLNTNNVASSVNISTHGRRVDASPPPNILSSSQTTTNMPVMMHGMNGGGGGGIIKSETAFTNNPASSFMYGGGGERNVLEGHSTVRGDTSIPSFGNNQQPLSETVLDAEAATFGFLGQIPRNFSLSDLTADFSQSSEILESYDKSPFLVPGAENFLDSCDRGEYQGDNKRLETISEGFSYDNLGSE